MAKLTGNIEHFIFSMPGASQELKVVGFTGSEKISEPFRYSIELACEDADLDFNSCINTPAVLTLIGDHDDIERHVHGIVLNMRHVRQTQRFAIFKVELVAQLMLLGLRRNSRIYQDTTVPDIIKSVFKDAKLETDQYKLNLNASYEPREYCVQYRETDLQFISRLMEEEGIYYYFEHREDSHLLMITDSANISKPIMTPSTVVFHSDTGTVGAEDAVREFAYSEQVQSGALTLRDFNFKKPALGLLLEKKADQFTDLEIYDYPGGYDMPNRGNKYAQIRLEALQAQIHQGQGESNCLRLLPGFLMELAEHPRKNVNQEYLITQMSCEARQPQVLEELATGEGTSYNNKFSCIPSAVPYRMPHEAKKPRVDGVQTAMVVGPAGEEIYVDEFSRVKVQFHWDRLGMNNEKSSCWIRVSQTMAGSGWGTQIIPRIGHEVIVDFIEGNPDRPIILGQVYHGTNRPPYPLPDEKTKSTIKTNSSKGGDGFNELRFEDQKGKEQLFMHAERNQDIRVKNDTFEWIGNERHLIVKSDQLEQIDGDKHLTVKGDSNAKISGTVSLDAGMDFQQKVGMNHAVDAGMEIHLKGGMNVVIEAGMSITLKAGGGFIVVGPAGVAISGTPVLVNSGGSAGSGSGSSPDAPKAPKEATQAKPGSMNDAAAAPTKSPTAAPPGGFTNPQAQTLAQAAQSGTPFCEKCEAARRAQAQQSGT